MKIYSRVAVLWPLHISHSSSPQHRNTACAQLHEGCSTDKTDTMNLRSTSLLALCLLALLAAPALCDKTGGKESRKEMLKKKVKAKKETVKAAAEETVKKVTEETGKKAAEVTGKKGGKKTGKKVKKIVEEKSCKGDVKYTIQTDCEWTRKTHPVDYPKKAELSPLCGTVHSKNYFLWRLDDQARNGAKEIAETGMCNSATDEIRNCQNQVPPACQEPFSFPCSKKSGVCSHGGEVTATPDHTYLSFQSMIAPSPDWSIGIDALQLCKDGEWIEEYETYLYPLDMGTDEGTTFTAKDAPNGLRRPITPFDPKDASSIFYNKKKKKTFPICLVLITLQE
ncbi:hypothetical protein BSKO_01190 [Bryopsis sp. KO-2023]|nr:hypothetical protein BSKO_01190 [Bryopsis sp. KO-2023]